MRKLRLLPLHAHLWGLFGGLVLAVGALICVINFVMTKQALETATSDATRRIRRETLDEVEELIKPAQMAVKLISHSALADASSLPQRLSKLELVRDALETYPILQSLYLGYADGSFFYIRLLRNDAERALFRAPPQGAYVVRSIEQGKTGPQGNLIFLDAELATVGVAEDRDFSAKFDPRQRPWYINAMATGRLIRTEPYIFFADQDAGATLAVPTQRRNAVVGGDFRLDSLGQMLASKETTPGSMLALLDAGGKVIAIDRDSPESASAPDSIRLEVLAAATDYSIPVLSHLAGEVAKLGANPSMGAVALVNRTIPLVTRLQDLQGVILLIRDTPMEAAQLAFVSTLASLSAGAIEVRALTEAQRVLFDAFIRLLAGAIDAKSPHTGGHCERVPQLAKMLAAAACDATEGPYQSFQMTDAQKEALHVAAWLHDCGKVTTPEYVIDKATKLETLYDRIHEIRMRFEVLKRDAEIAYLRAVAAGEDESTERARRDAEFQVLDEEFAFVAACNQGGEFMDVAHKDRLLRIASRRWARTMDDRLGISQEELSRKARVPRATLPMWEALLADKDEHLIERTAHDTIPSDNPWGFKLNTPKHLYDRGELHNLLVDRGTLSAEERFKIEDHIVQTQIMLSLLPFPKHLRQVPEIAGGHHEKMDGTGYPRRLHGEQMSTLARMMAIADVFEALTAADRPYKRAKTLSEAVRIMAMASAQQHIDPDLFDLFLTSGVYLRYAERFMRPEQIDHVDISQYVDRGHRGRGAVSA